MNMNEIAPVLTNKIDIAFGILIGVLSYIFGDYYILFVGYFALNFFDLVTGIMKARMAGKSNSQKGFYGILKKLGYWIIILISFLAVEMLTTLGEALNLDFGVTIVLGYATLGSLILNELRSIVENLVECGYHPPKILTKGLEVANKLLESDDEEDSGKED